MTLNELETLSKLPLFELLKRSRAVHEAHWEKQEVQLCTLLSIKTGGCSEDCSYCAQSARYSTGVDAERLLSKDAVMENAHAAKANGSTRFCMGAAWKGVRLMRCWRSFAEWVSLIWKCVWLSERSVQKKRSNCVMRVSRRIIITLIRLRSTTRILLVRTRSKIASTRWSMCKRQAWRCVVVVSLGLVSKLKIDCVC